MTVPPWREEPIARAHRRGAFDCGVPALDEYLARFARQDHEIGGAKTFVAVPVADPARVLGYYTLSPASLAYDRVPAAVTRRLVRHDVPVFRLGRLAVAAQAGGVALTIDAKDERAARWYAAFGALPLLDAPHTLVLPFATLARVLADE